MDDGGEKGEDNDEDKLEEEVDDGDDDDDMGAGVKIVRTKQRTGRKISARGSRVRLSRRGD